VRRRDVMRKYPSRTAERIHVAAVCYRMSRADVEFLLVRTQSGKWTFPKGGVDDDLSFAAAAGREAFEEGGVTGRVESQPFASYLHRKAGPLKAKDIQITAHLCRVTRQVNALERDRQPTWFSYEAAKKYLRKKRRPRYAVEIERVLEKAMERISRRNLT